MSPYGFPKISTAECRDQILAAIKAELDKRHEFAGVGNCFFGYAFDFKLSVTVVTRGERTVEIEKQAAVVQENPTVESTEEEKQPAETKTEGFEVSGTGQRGKRTKRARATA